MLQGLKYLLPVILIKFDWFFDMGTILWKQRLTTFKKLNSEMKNVKNNRNSTTISNWGLRSVHEDWSKTQWQNVNEGLSFAHCE